MLSPTSGAAMVLTELGRSLRKQVYRLDRWLEDNMREISRALAGRTDCP